jgi:hypothetical protein
MLKSVLTRDRETGLSIIRFILSTKYESLSTLELSLALNLIPKDSSPPKDLILELNDKRMDKLVRRIKACSGGLLEITKSNVA